MNSPYLEQDLANVLSELSVTFPSRAVEIRTLDSHQAVQQFNVYNRAADETAATVTISPYMVTVVTLNPRSAYTFLTPEKNPLATMVNIGVDPQLWSSHIVGHPNNDAINKCYEWAWQRYHAGVSAMMRKWEKENAKTFESVRVSCLEILEVAPSLPDVMALLRKLNNVEYDLGAAVPVDNYFIWSRPYLKALFMMKLAAQAVNP